MMDCIRSGLPPISGYENQDDPYLDLPMKFPGGLANGVPHSRSSYLFPPPHSNGSNHYTKQASHTGEASVHEDSAFGFVGNDQLASDKFSMGLDDNYLQVNNGEFSPSSQHDHHNQHSSPMDMYARSPLPRSVPPPLTGVYQQGTLGNTSIDINMPSLMPNGTMIDHSPHALRSPTAGHHYQGIKYTMPFDSGMMHGYGNNDYDKMPLSANSAQCYYNHRLLTNNNISPSAFTYPDAAPSGFGTTNGNDYGMSMGHKMPQKSSSLMPSMPLIRDMDVDQVDGTHKCKNTIEGTKTSVRRFKKWYKDKYGKGIDMNSINRFNAPEMLKDFFLEIRDTRPGRVGNEYEPVTLTTYRNGLRRYFLYRKVPPAPDNFDLTDKNFDIVNRRLISKRDDLKRKGKGNHPNAIESITPEQLEKMWASGAIGIHAPRPLLRLQWWLNTIYHGVRGRMAHHDLSIDDFRLTRSPEGKLCVEYCKNVDRASLKVDVKTKRKGKGRVIETDGMERDPVRAFEIYKSHRPAGISSFYLTPKHKPKGNIWFNKVPMGKNSIGRIMREIKAISAIN